MPAGKMVERNCWGPAGENKEKEDAKKNCFPVFVG